MTHNEKMKKMFIILGMIGAILMAVSIIGLIYWA